MGKEEYLYIGLLDACKSGNIERMQSMLKDMTKFDVNIQYKDGLTILMLASEYGHNDIVEILLKHGADVNLQSSNGSTALILARKEGYKGIMELLLKNGANTNI